VGGVEEGVGERAGRTGGAHRHHPARHESAVQRLGHLERDVRRLFGRQPDHAEPLADAEGGRIGGQLGAFATQHPGAAEQPDLQPAARPQLAGEGHRVPGVLERRVEVAEHRSAWRRWPRDRLG
jgi:hypothetical protein